jgi:RHS repeat-associated protein
MKKPGCFKKQALYLAIFIGSLSINKVANCQTIIHPYGSFCVGSTNIFAYSGPGTVSSWYVDGGGTVTNYGNTIQVIWNSSVSNIYVRAYYSGGSATYYNITISATVTPAVTINANKNNICTGTLVTFTATPVNGGSTPYYNWYINGTFTTGGTSNSYSTSSLTNGQQVACIMNTSLPCYTTYSATSNAITMTVNSLQSMSVIISGNTSVCQGSQVSFSASVTNGTGNLTYQWKKNGINVSSYITGPPPYVLMLNSVNNNEVISCVVSTDGCANPATSNSLTITIVSPQTFTIGASPSAINLCQGGTVIFTATSGLSAYNYQWYMNGSAVTGANSSTFTPTVSSVSQLQSVSVTASTSANCVSNTTATGSAQYIPFVVNPLITPNVSITVPATVILGSAATFIANPINGGSNPSYQWQLNGVNVPGAAGSTYTATITSGSQYQTIGVFMNSSATCAVNPATITNTVEILSSFWENLNYIRVHTIAVRGIDTWAQVDLLPIGDKFQSTTYMDGIGRSIQAVEKGVSPAANNTWKDIVKHYEYDAAGRVIKDFLPYATATNAGKFKTDAATEQQSYILSFFGEPTSPPAPTYSLAEYDESPLNRVTKSMAPGKSWAGDDKGVSIKEDFNNANEKVHVWNLEYLASALPVTSPTLVYETGTLSKSISTDEKQNKVISYTDLSGNLILKKVQEAATPGIEHNGWSCTYYVYDDLNRLRYTLSPEAVAYLDNPINGWNLTQPIVDELCFKYLYDDKGRTILKKSPGAKPLNMIYDIRDRVVFMQDGNQAALPVPQWTVNIYDDLDRTVITALYNTTETIATLKTNISNAPTSATVTINNPGTVSVTATTHLNPFSSASLNNSSVITILKYLFYDNYSFNAAKAFNTGYTNLSAYNNSDLNVIPIATSLRTNNMLTGSMTKVLGTTTFLSATNYYDERGQLTQSLEDNIKSGADIITLQHHFDGRLLSSCSDHTTPGTGYTNFKTLTKYLFDKAGRVTSIQKQFGGNPIKTISSYDYDEAGRLKTKHLDPGYTAGGNADLESLNYSYNIHAQITGINKDYALKNPANYNKWEHFFGLYLGFDNRDIVFSNANLTGQVTGQLWNTQGDDAQRRYDYTYDNAGRLSTAAYLEKQHPGDGWSNSQMDFSISGTNGKITYDLNGNLVSMWQKGVLPGASAPIDIDKLTYSYAPYSNKLQSVTDQMTNPSVNGMFGDFKDGTISSSPDYVYDDNGNLVIDLNKNVKDLPGLTGGKGIKYNFLDKPEEIHIAGKGTIKIVYSAGGEKLQRSFTPEPGGAIVTTTYINQFIYQETSGGTATLLSINFEEGRIRVITPVSQSSSGGLDALTVAGNITLPVSASGGGGAGVFDYYVMDYLQNVRMILTEETHIAMNTCTMETSRATLEESIFGQTGTANEVAATRLTPVPSGWTGNTSSYVSRIGTLSGNNIGPNALQKVMAGDKVTATVQYYYNAAPGGNNTNFASTVLGSLLQAIIGGAATSNPIKNNATAITNQLNDVPGFINAVQPNGSNPGGNTPQAYLTILFFDERFNLIPAADGGVAQVQVASSVGSNGDVLPLPGIKAPKNGYAFVYISNQSNNQVYFDNFTVSITAGNIIEENHYYAYGMKIAALSSKKLGDSYEGTLKNNYLYNSKELFDDADLNWYDYGFRNYDPQIGRFTQLDPLAFYYPFYTPYQYAGCEPIGNVDIDGLEPADVLNAPGIMLEGVTVSAPGRQSGLNISNVGNAFAAQARMALITSVASRYVNSNGQSFLQSRVPLSFSKPISNLDYLGQNWSFSGEVTMSYYGETGTDPDAPQLKPGGPRRRTEWENEKIRNPFIYGILNDFYIGGKGLLSGPLGYSKYEMTDLSGDPVTADQRIGGGLNVMATFCTIGIGSAASAEGVSVKYIGRLEDLKGIPRSQTLLDELPNLGSPKANYYQNMSVLRKTLRDGYTIKDASWFRPNSELAPTLLNPNRTVGQTFLGAERNLLNNRGLWP